MKISPVGIAAVLVTAGLGLYGWAYFQHEAQPQASPSPTHHAYKPNPLTADHVNWSKMSEEEWIVDDTVRNITNILFHAKGGASKPATANVTASAAGENSQYTVHIDAVPEAQTISLQHHIWAPENYTTFAHNVILAWKLETAPASAPDSTLLTTLTSPQPLVLAREGRRITDALASNPLDPELNEQAALLYGVFALREASGSFMDMRPALSRMTAHLAIARAGRPEPGVNGKMAGVILLGLVGRDAEALEQLKPLESSYPAWATALKMNCTGDWRLLPDPTTATLLEQLAWFRVAAGSVDPDFATRKLPRSLSGDVSDWANIAMQYTQSIASGHQFAATSIVGEMKEIAAVWAALMHKPLEASQLADQLNASPHVVLPLKSDSSLEVLGWPDWAAYYQRHVCHSLYRTMDFLMDRWGVPDDAKTFWTETRKYFSKLELYPLVEVRWTQEVNVRHAAAAAVIDLSANHPELITTVNWGLSMQGGSDGPAVQMSPADMWLRSPVPFGTTYDYSARHIMTRLHANQNEAFFDNMKELSPWNDEILDNWGFHHFHKKEFTADELREIFSAIKDYNLPIMRSIASKEKDPQAYSAAMKPICELDPNQHIDLGYYFADHNQPEQAAVEFRIAFEKATDRVMMANCSEWIVDYDFTHGNKEEAERIASYAAEVYSERGLETMSRLMEREGKLDEAEDYFLKIKERYEEAGPLTAFYMRHVSESKRYADASAAIVKTAFPSGMEHVSIADFKDHPVDGAQFSGNTESLFRNGLQPGDVCVAIEGVRVHNQVQYTFVRDQESTNSNFTVIVWSRGQYREIKANAPNRRFGCDLVDYRP